jgi:DNA-binding MarR family transcriptional regulator
MTASAASASELTQAANVYHNLVRIQRTLRQLTSSGSLAQSSLSALWMLVQRAPLRLSELAEQENVAVPTMSRVVAALERDGYVVRTADPEDGRAYLLSPTQAGIDMISGNTSRRIQTLEQALDAIEDADERAKVVAGLKFLADAMGRVQ